MGGQDGHLQVPPCLALAYHDPCLPQTQAANTGAYDPAPAPAPFGSSCRAAAGRRGASVNRVVAGSGVVVVAVAA